MDFGTIVLWAIIGFIVILIAWKVSAKFRNKAAPYIDRDGDGKPGR